MSLEPVVSEHHLIELRRLYNKTESSIRSLDALGVKPESYGTLLIPVFLKKLPSELRLILTRRVPTEEWQLTKIIESFLEELEARERANVHKNKSEFYPKHSRESPTMKTFSSTGNVGCCYCGLEGHAPTNCKTIVSIDERKRVIRSSGRCFVCLRRGHIGRDCHSSFKCTNCKGRHHTSICVKMNKSKPQGDSVPSCGTSKENSMSRALNPTTSAFEPPQSSSTFFVQGNSTVLLQIAQASIFNVSQPKKKLKVYILFDSGSQCSYITKRACQRLALQSLGMKSLSIMTFGSREEQPTDCAVVRVGIKLKNGSNLELKLLAVDHICEPIVNSVIALEKYPHLNALDLTADFEHSTQIVPDILLGSDQYWSLLTGEVLKGETGPTALNTHLGWILSGPAQVKEAPASCSTFVTHILRVDGLCSNKRLEKELCAFWDIESLGITENESIVQGQFKSHVSFQDGRYVVALPWKDSCLPLPNKYRLSLRRLNSLFKRLKDTPDLLHKYDAIIREQLDLGIVVPVDDNMSSPARVHYMPHHAVVRSDKSTTKVRVVYDASAKADGPSLNDCLHAGPSLHRKIFEILVRFRAYPVALASDIEKAFLMIQVAKSDQDVLRFLWFKDIHADVPELQILKFTRVVFGVAPSPYLLNATIACHLDQYESTHQETVSKIRESIYVDDVIMGAQSESEALKLYEESKAIFSNGGFNLQKFTTNCRALQEKIDAMEQCKKLMGEDESYTQSTLGCELTPLLRGEHKILGIIWDVDTDALIFNVKPILSEASRMEPTKRNVISLVSKIFDPLGILSPVIIPFKVFFQELCQSKVTWDEVLGEDLQKKWKDLLNGLQM